MSRALATVVKACRTDGGMCCRYGLVLVLARASRDAALRVWQLAGAARLNDAVRVDGIGFDEDRDTSDCLTRPEVALGPAVRRDVLADGAGLAGGSARVITAPGVAA